MATHYGNYTANKITMDSLVLRLDASKTKSYPGTGSTWYDISGNNNHFTISPTAFKSTYMDFNGSYGCAKKTNSDISVSGDVTAIVWTRIKNSNADWRTLFRGLSSGGDHQVIIQTGTWDMGMYDGTNSSGYNSMGFSQQSIPGYGTSQWNMLVWRYRNTVAPYFNFSYNDTPSTIRGSIASVNAKFKHGFCSIGAYNNANQTDPMTASQFWGDVATVCIYNRYLSDGEVSQNFQVDRARFGL